MRSCAWRREQLLDVTTTCRHPFVRGPSRPSYPCSPCALACCRGLPALGHFAAALVARFAKPCHRRRSGAPRRQRQTETGSAAPFYPEGPRLRTLRIYSVVYAVRTMYVVKKTRRGGEHWDWGDWDLPNMRTFLKVASPPLHTRHVVTFGSACRDDDAYATVQVFKGALGGGTSQATLYPSVAGERVY